MKICLKFLSVILTLSMLMGFSAFFASAEESTDYFYIPPEDGAVGVETYGFKNREYWDNVYVYASGGRSEYDEDGGMTYPGQKLEEEYVDGYGFIYTFSFAVGYYDTLLFHDGTKNDYRADLKEDFYDYCLEILGEDSLYEGADVRITDTLKCYDGSVWFTATSWIEPEDEACIKMIDNRCVHRSATYAPYDLGVYISTNDEIYTLEEALEKKVAKGIYGDTGFKGFDFHSVKGEDADLDLIHRCFYAFGDTYGYEPDEGEGIYCEPYGYVGDYVLFYAYFSHYAYPAVNTKEQIGDYYFYGGMPCGIGKNNSVALYLLDKNGEVFTLYDAYTQGLVTDLEAVAELAGGASIFGDYGRRILELLDIDINAGSWSHIYREILPFYAGFEWYEKPEEGTVPDFLLVHTAEGVVSEEPAVGRIGYYVVTAEHTYSGDELGYYVYFPKEDKVYSLEDAYKAYPEYSEKMISMLDYPDSGHYRLIGDADDNNRIDIKDATRIQKRVAGFDLGEIYREHLEIGASDFNADGNLNVRDATEIQKFIAGIE